MKRLCLLRHAKSEWGVPDQDDHDRSLNDRGRRTADFMASFICDGAFKPDAVICSTAKRACLTLNPLQEKLGRDVRIKIEPGLYLPMPDEIMSHIRETEDDVDTLLVVSHNPGLEMLSVELMQCGDPMDARTQFEHFPTAAFVVFDFDCAHWSDIAKGEGKLVHFSKPRELMDE